MNPLYAILGWLGIPVLLVGYYFLAGNQSVSKVLYGHILNLAGAVMIIINTLYHEAYAPMALNILWSFIALFGIKKTFAAIKAVKEG